MRVVIAVVLFGSWLLAQEAVKTSSVSPAPEKQAARELTIPAGTKIPISLRNAISTQGNHQGDPVYAQTTFPVVVDDRIVVPAGTYVQGKISSIKPAGRIKGRAEVLMHFTTLIYPSGYSVMLPGSLENAPAVDKAKVKDREGTIQADSNAGKTAETIAQPAATGALIGAVSHGGEGALIGAGVGGAVGTAIAALSHGNEVKLTPGTTFEVVLQREVSIDASRIKAPREPE